MTEEKPKRIYELKQIYLKDLSFESPLVPQHFTQKAKSSGIDLDVNTQFRVLDEEKTLFECVLMIRVTAKTDDDTLFLTDVTQAGIVEISGFSDSDLEKLLNIAVPNILLPYVRETISSLVGKGGFPPLLLRPINFERIYFEKLKADKEKAEGAHTEH